MFGHALPTCLSMQLHTTFYSTLLTLTHIAVHHWPYRSSHTLASFGVLGRIIEIGCESLLWITDLIHIDHAHKDPMPPPTATR